MKTVALKRDAVRGGNLILVNRQNPFFEGLCEKRLVPVNEKSSEVLLEMQSAALLQKLMDDLDCKEQIIIVSGYRSYYEQEQAYNNSLRDNGKRITEKYVALPNHSEHQTGLAFDIALNKTYIDFVRPYFPYIGICNEFRQMAVQFGFVERYPYGKENITEIAHEPWHFRYIGFPHSAIMQQRGLVLEEYLCLLRQYPCGELPFAYCSNKGDFEISYLAAANDETLFEIEDDLPYSVSGDNMSGFILTIWGAEK